MADAAPSLSCAPDDGIVIRANSKHNKEILQYFLNFSKLSESFARGIQRSLLLALNKQCTWLRRVQAELAT